MYDKKDPFLHTFRLHQVLYIGQISLATDLWSSLFISYNPLAGFFFNRLYIDADILFQKKVFVITETPMNIFIVS